ncbi:insulinase family protein [Sphingomonas sp. So64.6b]|uniref:M16 family metallopeptidase n=1 Tax=Sphingomonas sp. So64.6b TaxID=2997354 RepID=UPI0016046405|nr:insulinase family protein [Sphingomonas sp. So64.6b]QNA84445.1 insulinase family protein [Sphingomonas sp. So64.6b]
MLFKSRPFAGRLSCALTAFVAIAAAAMATSPALGGQDKPRVVVTPRQTVLADPDIRSGVLPNGMRYAIMHAANPAGGLSMRLGIDVGSFEERDAERGYAHFVEHLAFRTTRSAPQGDLDRRFAALGVAFGRDQNAATTLFSTTYRLDFSSTDKKGIDEGFRWLRDVADGVIFTDAGVAIERGVVLAERQSRGGPQQAVRDAISLFQAPGSRTVAREPGGTTATLAAARADTLRAFYDRWYRPEHAVLVVVGDQPLDAIEAQVRAGFGTWQGKGPKPVRASPGKVDFARGLDVFSTAAPDMPTIVSACRILPPAPRDEVEMVRHTSETRDAVWRDILAERFKLLVNAGKSGLVGAMVVENDAPEFITSCLIAVPVEDGWEQGMAAAHAEFRRFVQDGPTEAEVEAQMEAKRAVLRGAISVADSRTAGTRANMILDRLLDHRPAVSPREAMHAYDVAVETLDAPTLKAVGASKWAGKGSLVAVVLPTPLDREKIRSAWARNEAGTALAAFADHDKTVWPYADFGTPGTVASREVIADPGFVRLRFANGAILNFKQSSLETNGIEVRALLGAGRRELPADGVFGATLGASLLTAGGLGRLSNGDMERSLRGTSWEFDYKIGNDVFQLSRSTNKANIETQLQVFAAFMTDPGFRPAIDERLPTALSMMYRMMGTEPTMSLNDALYSALDPGHPEILPPPAVAAKLRSADFLRLLRPALTEAPIELTLVGDIDEATAIRMVAKTIGALPPRSATDRARPDAHFLRVPDRAFPVIRATHGGSADRAAASLIWPLYVAEPARRREEYALNLVAGVFNDEFRRRARVEMGKTYAPMVITSMPDHADQGLLIAQVESQPADLAALVAEGKAVAQRLVSGAITAEEVEAVRQPLLSRAAAARSKNDWWAAAMSGSARDKAVTAEQTDYVRLLSSVTLDEVKAAAAKWLARAPIEAVSTARGSPPASPPVAAARGRKGQVR